MRFAYLCCDFGVAVGGTMGSSVHVREMIRALRRVGHEVQLFAPTCEGDQFEPVPLTGTVGEVIRLLTDEYDETPFHLISELRTLLYSEFLHRNLLPVLATWQPEVVYERFSLFSYAGLELAREIGVPLVVELNAPLVREQSEYRNLVLKGTATELEERVLAGADAVIVVSRTLEEHVREVGVASERITVLPNGVDAERFRPSVSGRAARSRFGLDGKRTIGFVGSLKPWHDLDTLLLAVGRLHEEDPDIRLLIVGEGPLGEQLRAAAEPHVIYAGPAPHSEIAAYLAAMDVVVVPYARRADLYFSPLKLFEAMAMARPIVGARIGQVAEIIVEGGTGLLYDPGDASDLASKIEQIFSSPDRGARLGGNARERVVASHTWEQNARLVATLSQSLVEMAEAS